MINRGSEIPSHLVGVGPVLVLGPVGGVAEGLGAAGELAGVGLLSGVRPQVGLQVLQPGIGLLAGLELRNKKLFSHSGDFFQLIFCQVTEEQTRMPTTF